MDFLSNLYKGMVSTSTFVERTFSKLTAWSGIGPGRDTPGIASLASDLFIKLFTEDVTRWRDREGFRAKDNLLQRPVWARKDSPTKFSATSAFARDQSQDLAGKEGGLSELMETWAKLTEDEKDPFREEARKERMVRSLKPNPLSDWLDESNVCFGKGPLGIASEQGPFPLEPETLRRFLNTSTRVAAQKWVQAIDFCSCCRWRHTCPDQCGRYECCRISSGCCCWRCY